MTTTTCSSCHDWAKTFVLLGSLFLVPVATGAEEDAEREAQRLAAEIRKGLVLNCLPGEQEMARYRALKAKGDRIFPGVVHILNTSTNEFTIANTLSLVYEMDVDASPILPAVRRLITLDNKSMTVMAGLEFIGEKGTADDAKVILRMLDHKDFGVRMTAATALGQIGSSEVVDELAAWVEQKKTTMTQDEIESDRTIKKVELVLKALRAKITSQSAGGEDQVEQGDNSRPKQPAKLDALADSAGASSGSALGPPDSGGTVAPVQDTRGSPWTYFAVGLVVGLALGAAGAWLLLRRRLGGPA